MPEFDARSILPARTIGPEDRVHAFRDPDLTEDFAAPTVAVDVTRTRTCAVERVWSRS